MHDWKDAIVRMAYWKQLAAQHDSNRVLPWRAPRTAASDEAIARAEDAVRFKFPISYRDFLQTADGWEGFHIATDLFGTDDFISGRATAALGRTELNDFMSDAGFVAGDYVVAGASRVDLENFLLVSPTARQNPGGVIWFTSDEVDRFPSFTEFFEAMINYNARIAAKMKEGI